MGFWIFMLMMDLLIPLTMISFGRYFMAAAPKEINSAFGYRTSMSMKNQDTWKFAHRYCGKLWFISGLVLLPLSVAALFLTLGKGTNVIGSTGAAICLMQLIPLVGSVISTEIALKKTFDENGNRRI